jgi:hypothetical protein
MCADFSWRHCPAFSLWSSINCRETSGAYVVGYLPTVQSEDFGLWSEYSELHKGWMVDAFKVTPSGELQGWVEADDVQIYPDIWDVLLLDENGDEINFDSHTCGTQDPTSIELIPQDPKAGPASPIWLLSPPPSPAETTRVNYNMRSDPVFEEAVRTVEKHRTSTFHDICGATEVC